MRFGLRSDFERRRRSKGSGRSNRAPVVALPLAVALVLWSSPALAHDPSAWGGLFRSRDDGVTWFRRSGALRERGHRAGHQPDRRRPPPARDGQRTLALAERGT